MNNVLITYVQPLRENSHAGLLLNLSSLRLLSAVLRSALLTVSNAGCIKCASYDVITNTREVLNTSASDKYNRVLLKVVSDSRNVSSNLVAICKTNSCYLTKS